MKNTIIIAAMLASLPLGAQQPVQAGRGSYAAYPPAYKARTAEHEGFQASKMLTRKIWADETDAQGNPRPIPTNDWWTDVINNQYSGALWSYPAMLKTGEEGVTVAYPNHWYENGTEMKPETWLRVQAVGYTAAEARAADWHDWDVTVDLPAADGSGKIRATLAHGMPFTWFEFGALEPELAFSVTPGVDVRDGGTVITMGRDAYAIYYADGVTPEQTDGVVRLPGAAWVSVALLPTAEDFDAFKPYAASLPVSTEVSWAYDEARATMRTDWHVTARNLRQPGAPAPVMQGFLPHAYKSATADGCAYTGRTYMTPRGTMKMAAAADGRFSYSYRFAGMLPYYAAPAEGDAAEHGYNPATMRALCEQYAGQGSFGDDTYWGGKGLTQMALNMTFAKEAGWDDLYELSKSKLKAALVDWLTYTPGEKTKFFAYYPRWGGMLGFDVSYDSDAFNDHHFHYGYLLYASALLCLEDKAFADGYGEVLRMIAKDYANYDRADTRFPFLRTLDPWSGHSFAGGLGDHGNDNGNGQESSSEAMQGWGGVYLLGVALGDRQMRDAGLFGWMTESRGTAEYWFDRDQIHPEREHNYDYTKYEHPYNTNITCKGIGWWTWFSGDPLWMHSIQWMPVSPCLNYLSEDLDFVKWDYEKMRDGTAYDWFEDRGNDLPALAKQSVGNVVLCYMERYDPAGAAAIFDTAMANGQGIATGTDTGHISYFVIHSHLTHGDIDFGVSADCPTANAYRRADGTMSYMVYNPDATERTVRFYRDCTVVRTVNAAAGRLTVFTDAARFAAIEIESEEGEAVPPGGSTQLTARTLDQYGALIDVPSPTWSVSGPATVSADGLLKVNSEARRGTNLTVTARSGELSATLEIEANDPAVAVSSVITGVPAFVETSTSLDFGFEVTDQYGRVTKPEAAWTVVCPDNSVVEIDHPEYTFDRAGIYTVRATAGEAEAAASLKVLPLLPNCALHKAVKASSYENAGSLPAGATDGDLTVRWGSAHTDDEWIEVDLGEDHTIASVEIVWETAYGADYDILVAPDGAPDAWQTVYEQRNLSHAGSVTHSVAATGRYVRIKCIRRGTTWGYSLYELIVHGVPVTVDAAQVVGIDIEAPQLMREGETAALTATSVDFSGRLAPVSGVQWSSEPAGRFDGDTFTPLTYGVHTITAARDGLTATATVLVEEVERLESLTATPSQLMLVTGENRAITLEGENQFGGIYAVDPSAIDVTVTSDGAAVSPVAAEYDAAASRFYGHAAGDYLIDFGGLTSVSASVREIGDVNLALHKSARATSAENDGLTAARAVDGDMTTRWGSQFYDDQAITVDLQGTYKVNNVRIYWNNPAYATHYTVYVSEDGKSYEAVHAREDWDGTVDNATFEPVAARYVRVTGHKRSTQYGTSIDELEVYGVGVVELTGIDDLTDEGGPADVYTLQGVLLGRGIDPARLSAGVYIVRRGARVSKVMIR